MTQPVQAWTIDQLRAETRTPPTDPLGRPSPIRIERIERVESPEERMVVDVHVDVPDQPQRWRLRFDGMWTDLAVLPVDAAGIVLWANVEEWWATRTTEAAPPWLTEERID